VKRRIAWYVISTLRDTCIGLHLEGLRKHYPQIPVFVINNSAGNLDQICETYVANQIKNETILSLTVNQINVSKMLFEDYDVLCFSADDIMILDGGFIEKSVKLLDQGCEIVSFSTDQDPVAYCYTKKFFEEVGFNDKLLGKECTDTDLVRSVRNKYSSFPSVGEHWSSDSRGHFSKYVLNPHVGQFGKTEVNQQLEDVGVDSGVFTNHERLRRH
jgi:hypothetical protein